VATTSSATTKVSLPSDLEILVTREFDAPRDIVYKTMTDPKLIPQWWGPRSDKITVDKMEVRPGGKWRFVATQADGTTYAFRGEYREIVPGEKIVQTFEFEPMAGHISVETWTLTDLPGGRTLFTTRSVFSSKEDRDGMVQSGMESGLRETYERLDEVLASLKK
jgi:uncharacterized protein YndB with AHSA1/START domain